MHSGSRPPATTRPTIGLLAASLLLAWAPPCPAQVPEYRLKAEFLERFARFIEWPGGASGAAPGAPFVIGVYGDDPFGPYLDELQSRTLLGRPIRTRRVADGVGIDACHILFIARSERKSLAGILARTAGKPVLTVGDTEGFAEQGVIINFFFTLDNHIGFEVNDQAARRSGLKLSSQLLRLARLVGREAQP